MGYWEDLPLVACNVNTICIRFRTKSSHSVEEMYNKYQLEHCLLEVLKKYVCSLMFFVSCFFDQMQDAVWGGCFGMCLLKENGSKCYLLDLDNDLSLPKHSMHGYPRMNYIYKVLVEFPTPPPNFAGANVMNHPTNGFSLIQQPISTSQLWINRDASEHRVQSLYKGSGHEGRNTTSDVFNQSTLKSKTHVQLGFKSKYVIMVCILGQDMFYCRSLKKRLYSHRFQRSCGRKFNW